jgi:hypothetical protein
VGYAARYECPACGYAAELMHRGGEQIEVETFECRTCRELRDVIVVFDRYSRWAEQFPGAREPGKPRRWWRTTLWCPAGSREEPHELEPRAPPGPCPRCGVEIPEGEPVRVWD